MFCHLVLGCLRNGGIRHGYELCVEIRARSGLHTNPGNVYRELGKLATQGWIQGMERPADADPRRNPYRITLAGERAFDAWLRHPDTRESDLSSWLSFVDLVPKDELLPLLEDLQERLWMRSKNLGRTREDALAQASQNGHITLADVTSARTLFELKQVTAVLEFVQELRRLLPGVEPPSPPPPSVHAPPPKASSSRRPKR